MAKRESVCVVYSERYLEHETGRHVENPKRLLAIREALDAAPFRERLVWTDPRPATESEVAAIHDREYIDYVQATCERTYGLNYLNPDTAICHESFNVAMLAAGGVLTGIDRVARGPERSFAALVRPPGHHAERDESLGFCLFNNIAIGARYAQEQHGLDRVFILDWDVHHGNGTQHSFEDDPTVFFTSFHQSPFYPGTGRATEVGFGDGEGFTLNFPLPSGTGQEDFLHIMKQAVCPAIEKFAPKLLLVSAGFDAHQNDLLGGLRLTEASYAAILDLALSAAGPDCPVGLVLEGGYEFRSLGASVSAAIGRLAGEHVPAASPGSPSPNAIAMADRCLAEHPYFRK